MNFHMMKAKTKRKKKPGAPGIDVGAFSRLLQGKSIRKPFAEIEDLAGYIDALAEFVREEYAGADAIGEQGFIGFINEEIRVRISKEVGEVVSRNRFASSALEILIPFKEGEKTEEQELRKLFYHTQFRKTMKASQADLAHSFYSMLELSGVHDLLTRYGPKAPVRRGRRS